MGEVGLVWSLHAARSHLGRADERVSWQVMMTTVNVDIHIMLHRGGHAFILPLTTSLCNDGLACKANWELYTFSVANAQACPSIQIPNCVRLPQHLRLHLYTDVSSVPERVLFWAP